MASASGREAGSGRPGADTAVTLQWRVLHRRRHRRAATATCTPRAGRGDAAGGVEIAVVNCRSKPTNARRQGVAAGDPGTERAVTIDHRIFGARDDIAAVVTTVSVHVTVVSHHARPDARRVQTTGRRPAANRAIAVDDGVYHRLTGRRRPSRATHGVQIAVVGSDARAVVQRTGWIDIGRAAPGTQTTPCQLGALNLVSRRKINHSLIVAAGRKIRSRRHYHAWVDRKRRSDVAQVLSHHLQRRTVQLKPCRCSFAIPTPAPS